MKKFAKLDNDDLAVDVVLVAEEKSDPENWLAERLGARWVEVFGEFQIGFTYDNTRGVFVPPQPFNSWIYDEENNKWNAPIPRPDEENHYSWDEETTSWVEVAEETE